MDFDARAAKELKPGEHLTIPGCLGLQLRAQGQRKSWTYRYRSPVDGHMRQIRIGHWPAMNLAKAAVEWGRLSGLRAQGVDVSLQRREAQRDRDEALRKPRTTRYTIEDLLKDYVEGHLKPRRKARGVAEVQRMFDTMMCSLISVPAHQLTRTQAFELLTSFQDTPVQASKLRAELGAAWDYALDAGRLPEDSPNWWGQVMRGRLRSKGKKIAGELQGPVKRALDQIEVGRLIRWMPNFPRLVEDVLTMYLWTATRGSEICAMEGKEVSSEADGLWWSVPKIKTKNARHADALDLRVPLEGRAKRIVQRRLERYGQGFLFPSAGASKHVEQKAIQTAVHYHQPYSRTRPEQARPRLTVIKWSPHDLRRTSRTLLTAMSCPDDVAEAILGHMRGVYNRHHYDPQRRDWLSRLDVFLEVLAKQ